MALLLVLSGCQSGQSGGKAIISHPYYTSTFNRDYAVFDGGVIYRKNDDSYLHVVDFSTGKTDIFCSRPNCLHNDSTCNAYAEGEFQSYFAAGNKLYYLKALDPVLDPEISAYRQKCDLMVSDLNRENERKIGTLDGGNHQFQIFFWENSAYLFMLDSPVGGTGDYLETLYLVELDLRNNKLKQPVEISEDYSNQVENVAGVYEGELYFETTSFADFLASFSDISDISQGSSYWRYNLKSGALTRTEDGLPDNAPEEAKTGSVVAFNNEYCIIGKPLNFAPLSVLNLSTGEVTPLGKMGVCLFSYGDSFYYVLEGDESSPDHYRFNTSTGEIETVYGSAEKFPVGAIGFGIYGENEEYYYYQSHTAYSGAIDGYEQGSPLICRAKKDEITTPGYHAEITY